VPDDLRDRIDRSFRANYAFPAELPPIAGRPWLDIDPHDDWRGYLQSVFDYARAACGGPDLDWDGHACGWYHAPWMQRKREPMRGLTQERSSRPKELHPSQTGWIENFAVSLYDPRGGYALGRIWADPARPKVRGFAFPEGTVSVKLLVTRAEPAQVPYLRHAKLWRFEDEDDVVEGRLLQFDVAVKDRRAGRSGWFFGTYVYDGRIELPECTPVPACDRARWHARMRPVGLQWGNDRDLTRALYNAGARPEQSDLDPDVADWFRSIRLESDVEEPHLGRWGRMNGPVDNPQSACMACHGRGVDFGRPISRAEYDRLIPFAIPWDANPETERHFFRTLAPDEPFVADTQSTDYSLQVAMGLEYFREWVAGLELPDAVRTQTRDIPVYPRPSGTAKALSGTSTNGSGAQPPPADAGAFDLYTRGRH
jgi:hypothetical protein